MAKKLDDWLTYLEQLHPKAIDLGLDRIVEVAKKLNLHPFPIFTITVTGTNGKGSCCTLLEKILHAQGYQVGVYTSPHLIRYNERIRINETEVDDETLCQIFSEIERLRGSVSLTYFEFGTLAALWLFKHAHLDVVILEVGMGGRLDAVNIVDAEIAAITTVAIDHQEWLGATREAIGFEKAGIMRARKPAVCGDFSVPDSVRLHATQLKALFYEQGVDFGYEPDPVTAKKAWTWWSKKQQLKDLPLPAIELQNAATALQVVELLPTQLAVTRPAIEQGLKNVYLPGRFQIIDGAVQRILDVGHNPAAASLLAKQLAALPCRGKTFAVIAMLADKDMIGTVAPMLNQVDYWFVGGLNEPRGGPAKLLADCLRNAGAIAVATSTTVIQAYTAAMTQAKPGDRILVFGSFHTVAEVVQAGL